jgi:lipopolysaccharide/colanic/teichoic acid biosynthesis glycosyltransferase
VKRVFSLLFSIFGLLLLALPLAQLAWLVRQKLGSPMLFTQVRPGLLGKTFLIVKFRTMTDARDAGGALLPDAQRLTPFGCFLRTSSLDELPEL